MKRIVSLTLLLSTAYALHAGQPASEPLPMTQPLSTDESAASSLASATSQELATIVPANTPVTSGRTPERQSPDITGTGPRLPESGPKIRRSTHTRFDTQKTAADALELATAGAQGAALEVFGQQGLQDLEATLAALQAAKKDPNLLTVLAAASLTTAQVNAWAPLITTEEGRERIKQGCMKGVFGACTKKQTPSEQSQPAATRALPADSDIVTVRISRAQLQQMNALTATLKVHAPQPVVLTSEQALVARSALSRLRSSQA